MLELRFLDEPLEATAHAAAQAKDPRLFQASQLADRGQYLEAAELSQALVEEGNQDIRAIGYLLFGLFLESGVGTLPSILHRVHRLLTDDFEALGPGIKKERTVDGAVGWLFRVLAEHFLFHGTQKDADWDRWVAALDSATLAEMTETCQALRTAVSELLDAPQSESQIARLARCFQESLGPAIRGRERAEALAAAEARAAAAADQEPDELEDEASADAGEDSDPAEPAGAHPVGMLQAQEESPALQALLRKLDAFEVLTDRREMGKAAVVANDIRDILANFDPLVYFPRLFSNHFRLLSACIEDLMPYWEQCEGAAWHALDQFYRTDIDAFIDE